MKVRKVMTLTRPEDVKPMPRKTKAVPANEKVATSKQKGTAVSDAPLIDYISSPASEYDLTLQLEQATT